MNPTQSTPAPSPAAPQIPVAISPTYKLFAKVVAGREKKFAALEAQVTPLQTANAALTKQVADLEQQLAAATGAHQQTTAQAAQATASLENEIGSLQTELTAYQTAASDAAGVKTAMETVLNDPANASLVAEAKAALGS
jgi:predicted  nucleic acid-binding Zn-ribbon protein